MVEVPVLPDWASDVVYTNTSVQLSLADRLRVLLGGLIDVRLATFCQRPPGQVATQSRASVILGRKSPRPISAVGDSLPGEYVDAAVELIMAERRRQIFVEGWTAAHDDAEHSNSELADAAYSYLGADGPGAPLPEISWPWGPDAWKPKDRVRNLVRAGALYQAAAEQAARRRQPEVEQLYQGRLANVSAELSKVLAKENLTA